VLRHRLGLAADGDHRALAAVVGEPIADETFGRLAAGTLRHARLPLFAEQRDRRLHVAVRLLEGALAIHHPRAGAVAELLDECRRDLRHHCSTSGVSSAGTSTGSGAPTSASASASTAAVGSSASATASAGSPASAAASGVSSAASDAGPE